jgi:Tfp pilus assembly protein PilF
MNNGGRIKAIICAVIVGGTLIAYEPIRHNGFVNFDDDKYVVENTNVHGGITRQSVIWAFTKSYSHNWHPITWLSHMLDYEIYGLKPLGHHITNLLIHIVNSLLLFLLLSRMTGAMWRSGFVAAAFALHPVHVESVAWIAERKDMLSGLFWMLTILAYVRYAERPNVRRYVLVLLAFVMGLMSKPMVVTLPFVLLLLDWWPLGRFGRQQKEAETATAEQQIISIRYPRATLGHLIAEKIPLFTLSAISSVITFVVQKQGGAVVGLTNWPLHMRVINALNSYFNYVVKMVYPKGLAASYPVPEQMTTDAAALAVIGAAGLLVLWGRGRRWLVVGLLWYLGTLLPTIGLVQVGGQIMADRYTYLPSIGIFIIIAWGATELFAKLQYSKPAAAVAGTAALIAMVLLTRIQVSYWRDSRTLFERAIAVTKNNYLMHYHYGMYLSKEGKYDEAISHFEENLRIYPGNPDTRRDICIALLGKREFDKAIVGLTEIIQEGKNWPEMDKIYLMLGLAYEQKGNLTMAEANYRKAMELRPDDEHIRAILDLLQAKKSKTPDTEKINAENPQH